MRKGYCALLDEPPAPDAVVVLVVLESSEHAYVIGLVAWRTQVSPHSMKHASQFAYTLSSKKAERAAFS